MAMTTVSYVIIRLLQHFDRIEPADVPRPRRDPTRWPSEETRYDMKDGETTFKIGVTMSARDGVFVKFHCAQPDG
jgi:hypothetical protein